MNISSLSNTNASSNPNSQASLLDPQKIAMQAQTNFSQILNSLTSDQSTSQSNPSNSEFSSLIGNNASGISDSVVAQNDGLSTASLAQKIQGGDKSAATLQQFLYASQRDQLDTLNSIDNTNQSNSSDQSSSELSSLLGTGNPLGTSSSASSSDGLDVASLTQKIEAGDKSQTTLQELLFAYERDRGNILSAAISGDNNAPS